MNKDSMENAQSLRGNSKSSITRGLADVISSFVQDCDEGSVFNISTGMSGLGGVTTDDMKTIVEALRTLSVIQSEKENK